MDRKAASLAAPARKKRGPVMVIDQADAKTGGIITATLKASSMWCAVARMRWGAHSQFTAEANPGDFIFHPALRAAPRSMPAPTRCWNACWCVATGEAIAINLDIEPVEKPETVLWVDPIHRDGAVKA